MAKVNVSVGEVLGGGNISLLTLGYLLNAKYSKSKF